MESKTKLPFINLRSPEPQDRMTTSKEPKILMVDNDPKNRKDRINLLRAHGFSAYPALNRQQASTRCRPGAYDLIVVNSHEEREQALEFCEMIRKQNPQQLVLMMTPADAETTSGEGTVSDDPQSLLEHIEAMFPKQAPALETPAAA